MFPNVRNDEPCLMRASMDVVLERIWWLDAPGTIIYANRAAAHMLGYSPDEVAGITIYDLFPALPPSRWSDCWDELRDTGAVTLEGLSRRKDGSPLPVTVMLARVDGDGGQYAVAVVSPVTPGPEAKPEVFEESTAPAQREQPEEWLQRVTACILSFGPEPLDNINRITALCGELMGATCALYNRLDGGLLCALGQWQTPPDFPSSDTPEGHICYDIICAGGDELVVITDLPDTPYYRSDPNVARYGLNTYVGKSVQFAGSPMGALCVVYRHRYEPDGIDRQLLAIGAAIIGVEETRRQTELSLRASEQRLTMALATAHLGVWEWTPETDSVYWSRECHRIYGVEHHDGSVQTFVNLVHPDDRGHITAMIERAVASGMAQSAEYRIIRPDGEVRWVSDFGQMCLDNEGRPLRMVGIVHDITERKQAEDEIRRARDGWEQTFDTVPDAIAILDTGHRIVRLNRTMARALGISPQAAVGRTCHELTHGTDLPPDTCPHTALLGDGLEHCVEVYEPHCGGYFHVSVSPLRDEAGTLIGSVHVARNISERKKYEENLIEARNAAEAANRAKTQFLANMSHELRTPMNGVLGMLQLVLAGRLDPEHRELLTLAESSGRGLVQLLNDILDLTKIEANKLSMVDAPYSLRDCVTEVIGIMTPEARRKGLQLSLTGAEKLPDLLVGDQMRVRQVLTNLIGNAVKFTEQGWVRIRVSVTHSEEERRVVLSVADTGIGIPDDKKDLLFHPFSQVDDTCTRRYGGAGLGLIISKHLAEGMGGTISVESRDGAGSTFTFSIPCRTPDDRQPPAPQPDRPGTATAPLSPRDEPLRILVTEDDLVNRTLLVLLLKEQGFAVETAVNGRQAVAMWEQGRYDLIVMDVQMPEMDGIAATRLIREKEQGHERHTPILAMTAHAFQEDEMMCLDTGMDAYLCKPVDISECLDMIGNLVKRFPLGHEGGGGGYGVRSTGDLNR